MARSYDVETRCRSTVVAAPIGQPSIQRAFRRSAYAILAVILAFAAAGCSSSSGSSSGNSTAAPASSSNLSGEPVRIGVISSDTGATGTTNDTKVTVARWEAYINAHGGINGHPVDVIEMDDNDSPATALQDFDQLVQVDHVVVIGDSSYVDSAFEKAAAAAHIPVVSLDAAGSNFAYGTDPNFFPNQQTVLGGMWAIAKTAQLSGHTKLGILYCAEVAGCSLIASLVKPNATPLGVSIVSNISFSNSEPNYTAQCLAAKNAGVQIWQVAATEQSSYVRVVNDCAAQHFYPVLEGAGNSLGTAVVDDPAVHEAWGFTGTIPAFVRTSATAAFHTAMDSYLPKATIQIVVIADWAGLQLIATAAAVTIKAGTTPTSQDIYNGLYSFRGNTIGGLTPPLTYTKGKGTNVYCAFVYEIVNGQNSTPLGTKPICKS
jgi:branched-chain amino acid transport system substrate-binding protein